MQKTVAPDKPFFVYYATGATHARTTRGSNGSRSTRASSIRAGTRSEKKWRSGGMTIAVSHADPIKA
jgi:hypothetical protein